MSLGNMIGSPGQEYYANGNTYTAASSGLITGGTNASGSFTGIMQNDVVALINAGALPATLRTRMINLGVVKAASATVLVASAALSNGALTVAANPDIPRQAQFVINPGASAITAGLLGLTYTTGDGVTFTDSLSLVVALSTALTLVSTHGCAVLSSAGVSGLVGGTSPNIQGGTNNVLSVPADIGQAGLAFYYAATLTTSTGTNVASVGWVEDTLPTQSAVDGKLITPHATPNGTLAYSFGYNFYSA